MSTGTSLRAGAPSPPAPRRRPPPLRAAPPRGSAPCPPAARSCAARRTDARAPGRRARESAGPIEDEARDHRVVGDARKGNSGARERDPRRLDVVPRLADGGIGEQRTQWRQGLARERRQVARRRGVELAFAEAVAEGQIPGTARRCATCR